MRSAIIIAGTILMIAGGGAGEAPFPIETSDASEATPPATRIEGDPAHSRGQDGSDFVLSHPERLVIPSGTVIRADDGRAAPSVTLVGPAFGGSGGNGGNVVLRAPVIVFGDDVRIVPGNGGRGGNVISLGNPDAFAQGGRGGDAGRVILEAAGIFGEPHIVTATAGPGGSARAEGSDSACSGSSGRSRSANGTSNAIGDGDDAEARGTAGACGPVAGDGGRGGNATAYGGDGGTNPDGNGARGGDATAIAGRGGDGLAACFATQADAERSTIVQAGNGGKGGDIHAIGGDGGSGRLGGTGGSAFAYSEGGSGGDATHPILRGAGGSNGGGGGVKGGTGGTGLNGGAAGEAVFIGRGGSGGNACGELTWKYNYIPVPTTYLVFAWTVVSRLRRRR